MVKKVGDKKYYCIVEEFDDSKFEPITRKPLLSSDNVYQMHKNLWSMFDMKYTNAQMKKYQEKGKEPFGMNITAYGWTPEVKEAFYGHEYHKKLFKKLEKDSWNYGLWTLNHEPDLIDRVKSFEVEKGI